METSWEGVPMYTKYLHSEFKRTPHFYIHTLCTYVQAQHKIRRGGLEFTSRTEREEKKDQLELQAPRCASFPYMPLEDAPFVRHWPPMRVSANRFCSQLWPGRHGRWATWTASSQACTRVWCYWGDPRHREGGLQVPLISGCRCLLEAWTNQTYANWIRVTATLRQHRS